MKKRNEEEKKRICEEEGERRIWERKKIKPGGILVFSHLSDESRGIFVHSRAYESD